VNMKIHQAAAVVAAVVGLGLGCSNQNAGAGPVRTQSKPATSESMMNRQCIGRFQFDLPERLAVSGRTQSIYRTSVVTGPLPSGGAERAWSEEMTTIRARSENSVRRTFDLAPGIHAVWYGNNSRMPSSVILELLKPEDDHFFKLTRASTAGKEEPAEKLASNILASYAPHETGSGFCVGFGSLSIEPSSRESVSITMKDGEVETTIDTITVDQPEDAGSPLEEAQQLAQSYGGSLKVLRNGARKAAGVEGHELQISISLPGKPDLLRFDWGYEGVGGDAMRPKITVAGTAPAAQSNEMEAAWEMLMSSLQPIPLARR
jgi:hypothetical protein